MYEYLFGNFILGSIWLVGFVLRKDLRKVMVWSGLAYIFILSLLYLVFAITIFFLPLATERYIVPGYWNPKTLFNLGQITNGYAIEDALFMFFTGGIAAFTYDFIFKKKVILRKKHKHHFGALIVGIISAFFFGILFKTNLIYPLMVFGFTGAIALWLTRKDLIRHSLFGGLFFLATYFLFFVLFNKIFPDFISRAYNLENITGILLLGVPLEELLYALSFGLLWSPIYEYGHGEKDVGF